MPGMSRAAPMLLVLAGAALPLGLVPSVAKETELLPVHQTAPTDGASIDATGSPVSVKLTWSTPPEPVPVRFFVEVVAVQQDGPREVFAGYVDQSPADVSLAGGAAEYAWRVYAVGRDIPAYALGGWEHFSLRATK